MNDLPQKSELKRLIEKTGGVFHTADMTVLGISGHGIRKLIRGQVIVGIAAFLRPVWKAVVNEDELLKMWSVSSGERT